MSHGHDPYAFNDGGIVHSYAPPPPRAAFKTLAQFCGEYQPLAYIVEPIIRTNSVYTLTAKTGSGKTALAVILCLAVATGREDILAMPVECGRVAYLAFENPDDVRMRLVAACFVYNIDPADLDNRFIILDARASPETLIAEFDVLTRSGEAFSLIVLDTFAAGFDGADVNDNVAAGNYVRRLRPLSQIEGYPALVIAAHPTKNAADDNIVPYGAGAVLNEVDGNLCLVRKTGTPNTVLHWQGKFRGLEFQPITFRLELVSAPDLLDNKGRSVQLPVLHPCAAIEVEDREQQEVNINKRILQCLDKKPVPTNREIAEKVGISKSAVNNRLQMMKEREKLVEPILGKYHLTPKGRTALAEEGA